MKPYIDMKRFEEFARNGALQQGEWGDAHETACALSAAVGVSSDEECVALGWPLWLAEFFRRAFDCASSIELGTKWAREMGNAIVACPDVTDWDRIKCDLRMRAILPIALESIGDGNESWRVVGREAVQWSIDNGGVDNPRAAETAKATTAKAVGVAWAMRASEAVGAGAAGASEAAWAARAAKGVGVAWASEAAWAAGNMAWQRMIDTLITLLNNGENNDQAH